MKAGTLQNDIESKRGRKEFPPRPIPIKKSLNLKTAQLTFLYSFKDDRLYKKSAHPSPEMFQRPNAIIL